MESAPGFTPGSRVGLPWESPEPEERAGFVPPKLIHLAWQVPGYGMAPQRGRAPLQHGMVQTFPVASLREWQIRIWY